VREIPKLPMSGYLALPAVGASMIAEILDCPKKAWWNSYLNPDRVIEINSDEMDVGTIAHSILLEGNANAVVLIDPKDHPAQKTGNIPDGWTNKSIRAARDTARLAGKIPIITYYFEEIEAMVNAAKEFIASLADTVPSVYAAFQPNGGDSEITFIWDDGPTPCRIRPDRISKDRKTNINYKTTASTADPDAWGRTQMINGGLYIKEAFYRRGIEACCDVTCESYFLVQEQEAPYLCSLVGMDPHAWELGSQKVSLGLQEWQACAKSGKWPGYPRVVAYPEIPGWLDAEWEQRQMENPFVGKE
jgi:PDDEXK-like domain of unknown function (DUF3799)